MISQTLSTRIETHLPQMHGWCPPEKGIRLAQAIRDTQAELSVELGIFGGRGVLAMAMAHQEQGRGVAWGFDPWTKSAALEGSNDPANDAWWAALDIEAI